MSFEQIEEIRRTFLQFERDSWNSYTICQKGLDLTENELWIVLEVGDAAGVLCQADLARRLHLPVQTINSALTKLIKRGWLQRVALPNNHKAKGIVFTEQGEQECLSRLEKVYAAERTAIQAIDWQTWQIILEAISQYTSVLEDSLHQAFPSSTD